MSAATNKAYRHLRELDADNAATSLARNNAIAAMRRWQEEQQEREHQEWLRQEAARINADCSYWIEEETNGQSPVS